MDQVPNVTIFDLENVLIVFVKYSNLLFLMIRLKLWLSVSWVFVPFWEREGDTMSQYDITMCFTNTTFLTTPLPNLVCIEWFYLNRHLQDVLSCRCFFFFCWIHIRHSTRIICRLCLLFEWSNRSKKPTRRRISAPVFGPKSIKKQERNSSINKCFYCAEHFVLFSSPMHTHKRIKKERSSSSSSTFDKYQ